MHELSTSQQNYLRLHRKHRRIVCIPRVLILLGFLLLWEFTATAGIIDSFIFSSPSGSPCAFWK